MSSSVARSRKGQSESSGAEAGAEAERRHYPPTPPFASHEDLLNNPDLFFDTLMHFHDFIGTKFGHRGSLPPPLTSEIPAFKGNTLDLHRLYVEVTGRGGYDRVAATRKWKEMCDKLFNTSIDRNSLYVLKKKYTKLLYPYEKAHFNPQPTPSADSPCFSATGTIEGKFECGYLVSVKLGSEVLEGILYHSEQSVPPPPVSQLPPSGDNVDAP